MAQQSIVQSILDSPADAMNILHGLVEVAEHDDDTAALLQSLPGLLDLAGENVAARLAEAHVILFRSQSDREMLVVALRQLRAMLGGPASELIQDATEFDGLYGICQQAIEASTIAAIAELLSTLQIDQPEDNAPKLPDLTDALQDLVPAIKSLASYERVDMVADRLAYLAACLEHLGQANHRARLLGAADRPIVQLIIDNWLEIVSDQMADLQSRAQVTCRLLSRQVWAEDQLTIVVRLRNEGRATALNVRASLADSTDYDSFDKDVVLDRLAIGEETDVDFHICPATTAGAQFRVRFVIQYDDPGAPDQVAHFADVVQLLLSSRLFQFIPNPYVVGTPLQMGSPLFVGRDDLFAFIHENLGAVHRNSLVLIGQRRTGKSSLLKQLPLQLGDEVVPIFLDGQSIVLDPGLSAFFFRLAVEMTFSLEDRGFSLTPPKLDEFTITAALAFEQGFMRRVREVIGRRHLLLLLDEFEELGAAAERGVIDHSVFGFLRHLIQHEENLSVIFCGTHRIEEMTADYWNVLFNISLYKHVGFLTHSEAMRLIQEPVMAFNMVYDDLALEKIWRVTGGHPYFLQLLCHSLVSLHNRVERSSMTVADVNTALDEILITGEAHFIYLWAESTLEERLVLVALSRMMPVTGRAMLAQVSDYLAERDSIIDRHTLSQTLRRLALRDILTLQVGSQATEPSGLYAWRLGILGLWVEKHKSLNQIAEE